MPVAGPSTSTATSFSTAVEMSLPLSSHGPNHPASLTRGKVSHHHSSPMPRHSATLFRSGCSGLSNVQEPQGEFDQTRLFRLRLRESAHVLLADRSPPELTCSLPRLERQVRCDGVRPVCGACARSAAVHGEEASAIVCHFLEPGPPPKRQRAVRPKAADTVAALQARIGAHPFRKFDSCAR